MLLPHVPNLLHLKFETLINFSYKGFSIFHAIVAAAASLYLFTLIINRTFSLSETVMGVSIGYFLSDLAMIFYNYPALGGTEYASSHILDTYHIHLNLFYL
ncbi:hypothetical protein ACS0TY_033797 [Phlomoides rotata]